MTQASQNTILWNDLLFMGGVGSVLACVAWVGWVACLCGWDAIITAVVIAEILS